MKFACTGCDFTGTRAEAIEHCDETWHTLEQLDA